MQARMRAWWARGNCCEQSGNHSVSAVERLDTRTNPWLLTLRGGQQVPVRQGETTPTHGTHRIIVQPVNCGLVGTDSPLDRGMACN